MQSRQSRNQAMSKISASVVLPAQAEALTMRLERCMTSPQCEGGSANEANFFLKVCIRNYYFEFNMSESKHSSENDERGCRVDVGRRRSVEDHRYVLLVDEIGKGAQSRIAHHSWDAARC